MSVIKFAVAHTDKQLSVVAAEKNGLIIEPEVQIGIRETAMAVKLKKLLPKLTS